MDKDHKLTIRLLIEDFLKRFQEVYHRHRLTPAPFSALLFSYLYKAGYTTMVGKLFPHFSSFEDEVGSGYDFSQTEAYESPNTWDGDATLFSILSAFNPESWGIRVMAHLAENGFMAEYDDLFNSDNYPKLIEGAIDWEIALNPLNGEYRQAPELTDLMLALVAPLPGMRMYNPFGGMASYGTRVSPEVHYVGQELNARIWALGMIRLLAVRDTNQMHFTCSDSLANWGPGEKPYDLIISNPPLGIRLPAKEIEAGGLRAYDALFLDRAIASLSNDGKAIGVVAPRLLTSSNRAEKTLRKNLVQADLLDMVVSLPGGILANTSVPIVILILNKSKLKPGYVRFVNGESFGKQGRRNSTPLEHIRLLEAIREETDISTTVSNSILESNDWTLDPKRYFVTERFDGIPLGKLLMPYKGKLVQKGETGRLVRIRDLKNDPLDYRLPPEQVQALTPQNTRKVDCSTLLVALRWNALKPTLYDGSGDPILISSDLAAFEFDSEQIDPDYLVQQLLAPSTTEQVALYRMGYTVPILSVKDFLAIRIVVPDLEKQRKQALSARLTMLNESHEKVMQMRDQLGMEKLRHEENAFLRHSIAGPFSNLKFNHNELRDFLMDAIASGRSITIFDKIRAREKETIADVLNSLDVALELITIELQRRGRANLELESVPLTLLPVHALLEEYKGQHKGKAFTFRVEYDPGLIDERSISKLMIDTDRGLFFKLLDNLVANAESHAFEGNQTKRDLVHVYMTKQVVGGGDFLVLRVSNTGSPFPKGFDKEKFIRKNFKGGSSKGDGYGGHLINAIVDHMNGSFELLLNPDDRRFATSFQFSFPIGG